MNLIRNLLSHSVLLVVVAFGAYIYLNRTEILPEWFAPVTENIAGEPSTADIPMAGVTETGPVANNTIPEQVFKEDNDALLHAARAAFWNKDIEESAKHYQTLLATEAGNSADLHGELGNVYYMAGRWREAGDAYYEAAIRLIESGEHNRAHYLYKVISGLDSERAKALAAKLGVPDQG